MNKVIFVGFNTEKEAYEGVRVLHEMHLDGSITLYNDAVVVKDLSGKIVIPRQPDKPPVGTVTGLITGGLIGLLGGPIGAVVGFGAGTLTGAAFDLTEAGIDEDFVVDAGAHLEPGKAAVIGEIDETWEAPLDSRMESIGGNLLRRTRSQIGDMYIEEELRTTRNELETLEAETLAEVERSHAEKSATKVERLQKKIDEKERKLQQKADELAAKIRSVGEEGKQRIALLEQQKKTAREDSKAQLERRMAEVRHDYDTRITKLNEALQQQKSRANAHV